MKKRQRGMSGSESDQIEKRGRRGKRESNSVYGNKNLKCKILFQTQNVEHIFYAIFTTDTM